MESSSDSINEVFDYEGMEAYYAEYFPDDPVWGDYEFPPWSKCSLIEKHREELLIEIKAVEEHIDNISDILGKMCMQEEKEPPKKAKRKKKGSASMPA